MCVNLSSVSARQRVSLRLIWDKPTVSVSLCSSRWCVLFLGSAQDEWMCPTSHKSNFSSWLTKENFQLQQNGHRYRITDNSNHGNTSGSGDDMKSHDTLPHTFNYASAGHSDVMRSRLHSDTDVKEGRNVHFDDATSAVTSSAGYGSLRKPIVINCANTAERYISLG